MNVAEKGFRHAREHAVPTTPTVKLTRSRSRSKWVFQIG